MTLIITQHQHELVTPSDVFDSPDTSLASLSLHCPDASPPCHQPLLSPPAPEEPQPEGEEEETMLACANGEVRRLRSILDMKFGALIAADIPLDDDQPHTLVMKSMQLSSSSSSPKRRRPRHHQHHQRQMASSLPSYCDNSNVLFQQQQLNMSNLSSSMSDFHNRHDCHRSDDEELNNSADYSNCQRDDENNESSTDLDIFGIPIPTTKKISSNYFHPQDDILNHHDHHDHQVEDLDFIDDAHSNEFIISGSSVLSTSVITEPNCSILVAESPSRLDLSALLC